MILCLSFIIGCCNCKNVDNEEKKNIKYSVKLSPRTQTFLMKLTEDKKNETDLSKYIPSEKLRSEFQIILIEGIYYINGMLKINSNIDSATIEKLGVLVGTKAGNIWTVKIPLSKFENLSNVSGIDYLQIDEKVKH